MLLEGNAVRRAVRTGGDLGEVLMRPVDTASIEAEIESIDAERITALVDHFADHADYLVAALLGEDAVALDRSHDRITDL